MKQKEKIPQHMANSVTVETINIIGNRNGMLQNYGRMISVRNMFLFVRQ
jgi:hypothetical protein